MGRLISSVRLWLTRQLVGHTRKRPQEGGNFVENSHVMVPAVACRGDLIPSTLSVEDHCCQGRPKSKMT